MVGCESGPKGCVEILDLEPPVLENQMNFKYEEKNTDSSPPKLELAGFEFPVDTGATKNIDKIRCIPGHCETLLISKTLYVKLLKQKLLPKKLSIRLEKMKDIDHLCITHGVLRKGSKGKGSIQCDMCPVKRAYKPTRKWKIGRKLSLTPSPNLLKGADKKNANLIPNASPPKMISYSDCVKHSNRNWYPGNMERYKKGGTKGPNCPEVSYKMVQKGNLKRHYRTGFTRYKCMHYAYLSVIHQSLQVPRTGFQQNLKSAVSTISSINYNKSVHDIYNY